MLCAYHERRAHNFLKEVGPKKLWAQTSAVPLKKSSMGVLKVHKTIFRWSFLLLTYEQGAKQAL